MKLNNNNYMPNVGLGTFLAKENACYDIVKKAIIHGYRHIDTASVYENEEEVGRAIKECGVPREELFITSKLNPKKLGYENAKNELRKTLEKLQLEYIDLYLIHWPSGNYSLNLATYKALEDMHKEGLIKNIGVSNFNIHHLEKLLSSCDIIPQVNQVECHPYLNQYYLRKYMKKYDIKMVSYGPFAKGEVFNDEILQELAKKYDCTVSNIVINYLIKNEIFAIPKTVSERRLIENKIKVDLDENDMKIINSLNIGKRFYIDPDNNHLAIDPTRE